jgi:hypothetical protein
MVSQDIHIPISQPYIAKRTLRTYFEEGGFSVIMCGSIRTSLIRERQRVRAKATHWKQRLKGYG